jgi:hypothetical protein
MAVGLDMWGVYQLSGWLQLYKGLRKVMIWSRNWNTQSLTPLAAKRHKELAGAIATIFGVECSLATVDGKQIRTWESADGKSFEYSSERANSLYVPYFYDHEDDEAFPPLLSRDNVE